MSRSQSHQRKVWREYINRLQWDDFDWTFHDVMAWELATHDLMAFGTGCVLIDKDGNQRYLAPSEYYKADFIDSTEQPKI